MIRNKKYVYGEDDLMVPAELHYGKYMLHKFEEYKNDLAIIDPATNKTLTYSELTQMTVDVAISLTHIGVKKGDVISICSEERLEYMPTVLGIINAGAIFTSTDIHGEATILHRCNLSKPKVIFCSPSSYETHKKTLRKVESIEHFIIFGAEIDNAISFEKFLQKGDCNSFVSTSVNGWSDSAMVLYSSGTTGLPKAVPLSHLNVIMDMFTLIDVGYYRSKRVLTATEFYTFGLSCLHAGATVVFSLQDDAESVIEAVDKFQIEIVQQMPSTIFSMVRASTDQYNLTSLRRILSASAPFRPELVDAVMAKFPSIERVCQAYGATEAGVMCSDERAPKGTKLGSVGVACPAVVIKVVDPETREPLGVKERGEICFKSPSVFPGYAVDAPLSYIDDEGFYKTGDIGYYDEDQYFFIVDRIKDMIKYHGFAVAPAELEKVLLTHPAVLEAAVVGAPDEQYHELPTAFVVTKEGVEGDEEDIRKFVDGQVAHWMPLAGGVRFIKELPRGYRGKVNKKALREML